jgi:electron transfer flavoprotein alpha subunit
MRPTIKRVLTLVERENGEVATITLELLQAGRELADKLGANLCAAVLGHELGVISREITHFADEVYSLESTLLEDFQVQLFTHALEQLCRKIDPDIVLMGHILNNLDLAPRLACKLGSKLITDCIGLDIEAESGHLLCMKPVYGDNAIATFISDNKPQMVTLRSKAMKDMARGPAKGEVISFDPAIDKSLAKIELLETIPGESVSLDKADVIVAGGRGIKKIEGLKGLKEIIAVLKGSFGKVELGVSRPLVDAGWLPPSRQIGLTGEKVSPQLYIAIGISGASQHLSGILGANKIIAINRDEQAAIFKSADYGVVGEYEGVLPAFIKKLRELL